MRAAGRTVPGRPISQRHAEAQELVEGRRADVIRTWQPTPGCSDGSTRHWLDTVPAMLRPRVLACRRSSSVVAAARGKNRKGSRQLRPCTIPVAAALEPLVPVPGLAEARTDAPACGIVVVSLEFPPETVRQVGFLSEGSTSGLLADLVYRNGANAVSRAWRLAVPAEGPPGGI